MTTVAPNTLYTLRKRPKQQRAKATVEAVLDAGARILVEVGYAKASTNLIAETAGIGASMYDWNTLDDAARRRLTELFAG